MILDAHNALSTAQALTASAASENYLDLGAAGSPINSGMSLFVRVGTALDSSGEAATLKISLQSDDNTSFSSPVDHVVSDTFTEAECATANTILWKIPLPHNLQRYVQLYYTVGTENFTSGTVDAYVAYDVEQKS